MDRNMFWSMIDDARAQSAGDIERQHDLLTAALVMLSEREIMDFDRIVSKVMGEAYRADVWDAASLIACWCSDDAFSDFREWLVAQGRAVFEMVLSDPENLAEVVEKMDRCNIFDGRTQGNARDAYEQKTNRQLWEEPEYLTSDVEPPILIGTFIPEGSYSAKFPRLWAKFGECGGDEEGC